MRKKREEAGHTVLFFVAPEGVGEGAREWLHTSNNVLPGQVCMRLTRALGTDLARAPVCPVLTCE